MSKINNGGPAFPNGRAEYGMTMREYYAANAPITLHDAERALLFSGPTYTGGEAIKMLVLMRKQYADNMISALSEEDTK